MLFFFKLLNLILFAIYFLTLLFYNFKIKTPVGEQRMQILTLLYLI